MLVTCNIVTTVSTSSTTASDQFSRLFKLHFILFSYANKQFPCQT